MRPVYVVAEHAPRFHALSGRLVPAENLHPAISVTGAYREVSLAPPNSGWADGKCIPSITMGSLRSMGLWARRGAGMDRGWGRGFYIYLPAAPILNFHTYTAYAHTK
jgi:hypothetical protein